MKGTNASKITISLNARARAYYQGKAEKAGEPLRRALRKKLTAEAEGRNAEEAAAAILRIAAQGLAKAGEAKETGTPKEKADLMAAAFLALEELAAIEEEAKAARADLFRAINA